MGAEVPKADTPLSELELASFLYAGYRQLFGKDPSSDELAGGWSQVAIETGRGRAMRNYNFGNLTTNGEGPDYYVLETNERVARDPDRWEKIRLKFVAFPNALAGARGYWALLSARYAPALEFFRAGQFREAAEKLSLLGYFTAPVESSGYRHLPELASEFKSNLLPKLNLEGLRVALATAPTTSGARKWPVLLGLAALVGVVGWQMHETAKEEREEAEREAERERALAEDLRLLIV